MLEEEDKQQVAAKKMMRAMNRNPQGVSLQKEPESPSKQRMVKLVRDATKQKHIQTILQCMVLPKLRNKFEIRYWEYIRKVKKYFPRL